MKYLKNDAALLAIILLGISLMAYAGEPVESSTLYNGSPAVHRAVH